MSQIVNLASPGAVSLLPSWAMRRSGLRSVLMAMSLAASASACDAPGTDRPPVAATAVAETMTDVEVSTAAPFGGAACWADSLPRPLAPIEPRLPAADSCRIGAIAASWTYPASTSPGPPSANDDGLIVGRWIACDGKGVGDVPHTGIEFGPNNRYQLLVTNAAGELVPADPSRPGARGYYYLLGGFGQLDLYTEDLSGWSGGDVTFASGMDTISISPFGGGASNVPGVVYARTTPSPANGAGNPPSTSDGRCSMVGTWDVPASTEAPASPPAVISFDAAGNFVGGEAGSDLCSSHRFHGTYSLAPGRFELTTSVGMGLCAWDDVASYPATFDGSCAHVTLRASLDGCAGGRGYLDGTTTLTRRAR
jgi:hypothetical protein